MSFYNKLFNENEDFAPLLGMLGVNKEFFDRYRDVELIENGEKIRVFTRLGGGNREGHEETWDKIQKHELYVRDYDDDFDETYAYIEFKVPDEFKDTAKKMFKGEPISFKDKMKKEIEDMDKPGTGAYNRAQEIANILINAMEDGNDNGNNIHIIRL